MTDPTTKVSRDLREIVDLSTQLLTQAVHDANATVDGTSLPGGRAMVALALVNDPESFDRRASYTERAWVEARPESVVLGTSIRLADAESRPDPFIDEDDDTAPALQILRFWSERYRWELGMVWDHIPTLPTEARFLGIPDVLKHVTHQHPAEWEPFTRDINRARLHLESILHAGRRPDRSRVVCTTPNCEDPKPLIRVHGPTFVKAWSCICCGHTIPEARACEDCHAGAPIGADDQCRRMVGKKDDRHECQGRLISTVAVEHCPDTWCFTVAPPEPVLASEEETDRWKCTTCKTRYDNGQYLAAHAEMLRDEGAARFVTVREAVATLVLQGTPAVTVRSWLRPPRRHTADRCKVCRRTWPPLEHNVCPGKMAGTLETCGGELRPVRRGNPNDVLESYCDVATHQVLVWWPDIWRRHLVTRQKAIQRKARAAQRRA